MAVVIAANRTRHPLDARTLARLAAQYAGRGVVGFGLSNDERRGVTTDFAPAFAIAERAGLRLVPHGGELLGPASVRTCVESLHAHRLGHGVRSVEDEALLAEIVERGIALEICPVSNVALGVYSDLTSVPLPELLDGRRDRGSRCGRPAAVRVAAGAQYATMRAAHELSDETLAELAAMSVRASCAPDETKAALLADVSDWLQARRRLDDDAMSDDDLWRRPQDQQPADEPARDDSGDERPLPPGRRRDPADLRRRVRSHAARSVDDSPSGRARPPPANPYGQAAGQPARRAEPLRRPRANPARADRVTRRRRTPTPRRRSTPRRRALRLALPAGVRRRPDARPPVGHDLDGARHHRPGRPAVLRRLLLIVSPVAWVLGAKAVREIDASPGRYGGRDRAQAGKIMGIIGTVLLVLGVLADHPGGRPRRGQHVRPDPVRRTSTLNL